MISFLVTGTFRARWLHQLGTSFECITWNALNELAAVSKNTVNQATYSYDPLGRRVEKVAGGVTHQFLYNDKDWVRRTGGTMIEILHGPGSDQPLAQVTGGAMTYFHSDALGTVQKQTSVAGLVESTTDYDAWGNPLSGSQGPYGFTGREPDSETSLTYYRARYYEASTGRFISEDPLGFRAGVNFWSYVHNRPTVAVDPTGLCTNCDPCPSGRWTIWSVTVTGAAGVGISFGYGSVRCEDNPRESRWVKVGCVLFGPILTLGASFQTTLEGTVHVGACRASDLPAVMSGKGHTSTAGPVVAGGSSDGYSEVGAGPSWGAGWALTDCVIRPLS